MDSVISTLNKLSADHSSEIEEMQKVIDALRKENDELKQQNQGFLQGMQAHLDNIHDQIKVNIDNIMNVVKTSKRRRMSIEIDEIADGEDIEPFYAGKGMKSNERKAWEERQKIKMDFPLARDN